MNNLKEENRFITLVVDELEKKLPTTIPFDTEIKNSHDYLLDLDVQLGFAFKNTLKNAMKKAIKKYDEEIANTL